MEKINNQLVLVKKKKDKILILNISYSNHSYISFDYNTHYIM